MPFLRVALDLPVDFFFEYRFEQASNDDIGYRVRVPFGAHGNKEKVGIIVAISSGSELDESQIRDALEILRDIPPLPVNLLKLVQFVSAYYQASANQVILSCLPVGLKRAKAIKRRRTASPPVAATASTPPPLTEEQQQAIDAVSFDHYQCYLLHGVTGSGKTEVYLQLIERVLAKQQQILLMVPEINLTPQLESHIHQRFPQQQIVALHSDVSEAARERSWLAAARGEAAIVLGTRLSIFTPLPRLGLIIVDEEHDISYRQQDHIRYSARDVAIFRANSEGIPVILGSATPALESWFNSERGRYQRLSMAHRANPAAQLPSIRIVNTQKLKLIEGLSAELLAAIAERLQRGEQSLVFINRRGYAPTLSCVACGWVAHCHQCSANLVVHSVDRTLRCHHCGFCAAIPRACPTCGNQDIEALGRGTQRVELALAAQFPQARILRVDRDSVSTRQQWLALLTQIEQGAADILVGTQMLAKGHDFPQLTLVGVVGCDASLMSADCRAPERLFAQLMQVAGRAGRAKLPGTVYIQTKFPDHPLFATVCAHDYPYFAALQLQQRQSMNFPPFSFQAMLRADAPQLADAINFLQAAIALPIVAAHPEIILYDPVPMNLVRLANLERGQLLLESPSRPALQRFLQQWRPNIAELPKLKKFPSQLRWHIEVDPVDY